MNDVDTNVLIYLHDSREPEKQAAAKATVERLIDGILIWQVGCEFVAASRKLLPIGYSQEDAWNDLQILISTWHLHIPDEPVLVRSRGLLPTACLFGTPC